MTAHLFCPSVCGPVAPQLAQVFLRLASAPCLSRSLPSLSTLPSPSLAFITGTEREREREGENEGENDRSTRSWEATTDHYGPIGVTWTLLQATILPSWTRACDAKDPDRCVRETNEIRNIEREEEIRYPL